jgi:hypothetical protein
MRVLPNSALAISCFGLAIFAAAAGAHAQGGPQRIVLKSGESTELRNFYFIANCQSTMIGGPVVEVLEGPPELTVTLKESMVPALADRCAKPVAGGKLVATAKDIQEPKQARLTIRVKANTKFGDRQFGNVYNVSLFP